MSTDNSPESNMGAGGPDLNRNAEENMGASGQGLATDSEQNMGAGGPDLGRDAEENMGANRRDVTSAPEENMGAGRRDDPTSQQPPNYDYGMGSGRPANESGMGIIPGHSHKSKDHEGGGGGLLKKVENVFHKDKN